MSYFALQFIPSAAELVKLSQCGGADTDLLRMERLVLEKLQYEVPASVTPLTFLQSFCEVLASKEPKFEDTGVLNAMIAKLEVLMCQFHFAKYRVSFQSHHMLPQIELTRKKYLKL